MEPPHKATPPVPQQTSHFPQLVRPIASTGGELEPAAGASSVMSPTSAPWALVPAPSAPAAPSGRAAVDPVVCAAPRMPQALPAGAAVQYLPARKKITGEAGLKRFLASDAIKDFVSFILSLNESVRGKKLSDPCPVSAVVQGLLDALSTLSAWVDQIPPAQQPLRYGNPAYRVWYAKVLQEASAMMVRALPEHLAPAAVEITPYWCDSFGNPTRIDYGTGHETTFCALLFCLARLGAVGEADRQALVTRAFAAYLALMRKVQTAYWLEPAGSHGVWGLDDYQFLPFIWGSAQLAGHPMIKPKSIHNKDVLEMYDSEYLYLGCVAFVKRVKKGPLAETSPIINDVSGVPSWLKVGRPARGRPGGRQQLQRRTRRAAGQARSAVAAACASGWWEAPDPATNPPTQVNSGMVKMYQVEVLSKFPIMQHFLFGGLLPFE
jgi:serine/threonine-protein phosphatase 2A activator